MEFNFNAPPAGAGAEGTNTPSGQGFGAPPAQPMTAGQAMEGFADASIDLRDPFLPVGFNGDLELIDTVGKDGRDIGFAIYIRAKVARILSPGGGTIPGPLPHNANLVPAAVGNVYALRIDGFKNEDSRKFAFSDLKLFLLSVLYQKGARANNVSPQQWNELSKACSAGKLGLAGTLFNATTSIVVGEKSKKAKLKVSYAPVQAA